MITNKKGIICQETTFWDKINLLESTCVLSDGRFSAVIDPVLILI